VDHVALEETSTREPSERPAVAEQFFFVPTRSTVASHETTMEVMVTGGGGGGVGPTKS
jgi:hypothetical protein